MVCINENSIAFLEKHDETSNGFSVGELDSAFCDVFNGRYENYGGVPPTEEQRIALSRALSAAQYLVKLSPDKTLRADFFRDFQTKCSQKPAKVSVLGLSLGGVRDTGRYIETMVNAYVLDPQAPDDINLSGGALSLLSLRISVRRDGESGFREIERISGRKLAFDNHKLYQSVRLSRDGLGDGFAVRLEFYHGKKLIQRSELVYQTGTQAAALSVPKAPVSAGADSRVVAPRRAEPSDKAAEVIGAPLPLDR